jgi:hypothetical protein
MISAEAIVAKLGTNAIVVSAAIKMDFNFT